MSEKEAWDLLCHVMDECGGGLSWSYDHCEGCPVREAGGDEDCARFVWDAVRRA